MTIDEQELRALAFLATRVRKATSGAGPWDEHGLMTNLRKLQNRSLHMTIEHVLRHAADPTAKTPGVLLGSFTPAAPTNSGHPHPPRREEQCLDCGRRLDVCAASADCGTRARRRERGDAASGAKLVRAAMGTQSEQQEAS